MASSNDRIELRIAKANNQYSTFANTGDVIIYTRQSNKLILQSGNQRGAIVVDNNNNVGIGKSSPASQLDISGNASISNILTSKTININSGLLNANVSPNIVSINTNLLYADGINNRIALSGIPDVSFNNTLRNNTLIETLTTTNTITAPSISLSGITPITITSNAKINNLNADLLDGLDSIKFMRTDIDTTTSGSVTANRLISIVPNGTAPLSVLSSTKITNLNADLLDGFNSTFFLDSSNINTGTLNVAYGGIGTQILNTNKILVGNGSNSILSPSNLTWNNNILDVSGNIKAYDIDFAGDLYKNGELYISSQWTDGSNNQLYYDLGYVGIGTNYPQESLDVSGNIKVTGNIIPSNDSVYNLGSSTKRWKDIYLSSTIDISGALIKRDISGIILVNDNNDTLNAQFNNVTLDGNIAVGGNFSVLGTLTTIDSTVVTVQDPIITLGLGMLTSNDGKDRGIEFLYYNGSVKQGFFGFDNSSSNFVYLLDAYNNNEVLNGTYGNIEAGSFISSNTYGSPFTVSSSTLVTNLNTDLLDSQDGSYYLNWNNFSNIPNLVNTFNNRTGDVTLTATDISEALTYVPLDEKTYNANDVLAKLITVDGSGSQLDADFLDGENGTYYLNATNATGILSISQGGIGTNNLTPNKILVGNGSSSILSPSNLTWDGIQLEVSGNIIPSNDSIYNLGSATKRWKDIYLSGSTIDISGALIKRDISGIILVNENNSTLNARFNDITLDGNIAVGGNLSVIGTLTTIDSTVVTIQDPIITLGLSVLTSNDGKDRGIEFLYYNGSIKQGFFGFDNTSSNFVYLLDASNNNEVFTGTFGNIQAGSFISSNTFGAPFTVSSSGLITNLNVDFLDGQDGSYYLNWDNFSNIPNIVNTFNNRTGDVTLTATDISEALTYIPLDESIYNASDILAKLITVDGSGSQLDADFLDGENGMYYRNMDNVNNGTLKVEYGGTGNNSLTSGKLLVGNGTNIVLTPTNLTWNGSNLGIGSLIPSQVLDVSGNINFGGNLYKNGQLYISSQWVDGSNNDLYYNLGNIGIGTSNPTQQLDISGTMIVDNFIVRDEWFIANDTPYIRTQLQVQGISKTVILTSNTSIFDISMNGRYRLDKPQDVHIYIDGIKLGYYNSSNNDYTVSVNTQTNYTVFTITLNEIANNGSIVDIIVYPRFLTDDAIKEPGYIYQVINSPWDVSNNSAYYNIGNVGIGTNNPLQALDVSGNASFSGDISASNAFFSGNLIAPNITGNSSTATQLATSRNIQLSGDVSGNVLFNGTSDVNITTIIQPNSVELGIDTSGNYISTIIAGTDISISGSGTENANVTIGNTATLQTITNRGNTTTQTITAPQFISNSGIGTAPFIVISSTLVTNLNVDLLDGFDGTYYLNATNATGILSISQGGIGTNNLTPNKILVGNGSSNILSPSNLTWDGIQLEVSGNIIPSNDSIYNLGSTTKRWKDIYLSGSTIDISGALIKRDISGIILVNENNSTLNARFNDITLDGNIAVGGNFSVIGTLTTIDSTIVTIQDPIITLGLGIDVLTSNDGKDRGIEFLYYNGSVKQGFFGFDNTSSNFVYLLDASNNNEVFTGTYGNIQAGSFISSNTFGAPFTVSSSGLITNLNSDLLDSQDGSYYLNWNNFSNIPNLVNTFNNRTGNVTLTATDISEALTYVPLDESTYNANDILAKLITVDGSGSQLDADFLDGENGMYYRNMDNVNNGTLKVEYGGTGNNSLTSGKLLVGNGTNAILTPSNLTWNGINLDVSGNASFTGNISASNALFTGDISASNIYISGILVASNITGNSSTATQLATSRNIQLSGDVSGNVLFDGTSDVNISTIIQPNSVELGIDTSGNYISTIIAGTDISISGSGTENANVTIGNTATLQTVTNRGNITTQNITAPQFISNSGIGIAPFIVTSSTLVTNLNVDLLDGFDGTYYLNATNATGILSVSQGGIGTNNLTPNKILIGNGSNNILSPSNLTWDGIQLEVSGNIIPSNDSIYNLGSATKRWKDIYLSGSTIDISGALIKRDISGIILVNENNSTLNARFNDITLDGNIAVGGNLSVLGTLTTIDSTVVTIQDPIITLGLGIDVLTSNDGKYRGVEFLYYNGSVKQGFFGFDNTSSNFVYLLDASNNNEVFTGTYGNIQAGSFISSNTFGAPFTVSSSELVTNLNTDLLDSQDGSYYLNWDNFSNIPNLVNTFNNRTGDVTLTATDISEALTYVPLDESTYNANDILAKLITVDGSGSQLDADFLDGENGMYYRNMDNVNNGTLKVEYGGTGNNSLTSGKLLVGNGTNAILTPTNLTWDGSNLDVSGNASFTGNISASNALFTGDISASNIYISGILVASNITGNSSTATQLATSRNIQLSGDVSGNVLFDGTSDVNISTIIQPNSVELGIDTSGNYISTIIAGTDISISGSGTENANVTIDNTSTLQTVTNRGNTTTQTITAPQFISNIGIGTTPFIVTSSTLVTNLNADLLDGFDGTYYLNATNATGILSVSQGGIGTNNLTPNKILVGNGSSNILSPSDITWDGIQLEVSGNIIPSNDSIYNLGSATNRWKDIYLSGSTIDISGALIKRDISGIILVNDNNNTLNARFNDVTLDGNIAVGGNFSILGTLTTIDSTIVTVQDPIITLGLGIDILTNNDGKDRGIEFLYHNGSVKQGFFGFDNTSSNFVYLLDASNNNEVFTGTYGNIQAGSFISSNIYGAPFTVSSSGLITNLNTDLLDSQDGSYYLNWDNFSNIPNLVNTFNNRTGNVTLTATDISEALTYIPLDESIYNASDILAKLITVDGSGSQLDADFLDGENGMYYRNMDNVNNGTLKVEYGGTGNNSLTSGKLLVGNGTNPILTPTNLTWDGSNLDVSGNVSLSGNISTSNALFTGDISASNVYVIATISATNIDFSGDLYKNGQLYISSQWTDGSNNELYYNLGNVGIGSSIPSQALDVSGNISASNVYISGNLIAPNITGNSSTATQLATSRNIQLSGDVSGNVLFDGTSDVNISTIIQPNSVELGIDTSGNYISTIIAGTDISVSGSGTENANVTIDNTSTLQTVTNRGNTTTQTITAPQFISNIGIGTTPFIVISSTLVTNLNVDLLDGFDGTYYLDAINTTGILSVSQGGIGTNNLTPNKILVGNGSSNILSPSNLTWDGIQLEVSGNIIPSNDSIYNLGSATNRWKDIYLSGSTIDISGALIKRDISGIILVNENNSTLNARFNDITLDGNIAVGGNFSVLGTLTTIDSTIVTVQDPIITLGLGINVLTSNDGKDRGIEFLYYNGSVKQGFFGFDNISSNFVYLLDASNNNEVFTGTFGNIQAGSFISSNTSGAPFTVSSSGLITNLNSDLLDSQDGSYYLNWDNFSNIPNLVNTFNNRTGNVTLTATDISEALTYVPLDESTYNASDILAKLITVDGSGSQLDADFLDGENGMYYRNMDNVNNGTLKVEYGGTGNINLTSGKLLVGNGTNAILTPTNLTWDGSNLGIGTNIPQSQLHMKNLWIQEIGNVRNYKIHFGDIYYNQGIGKYIGFRIEWDIIGSRKKEIKVKGIAHVTGSVVGFIRFEVLIDTLDDSVLKPGKFYELENYAKQISNINNLMYSITRYSDKGVEVRVVWDSLTMDGHATIQLDVVSPLGNLAFTEIHN